MNKLVQISPVAIPDTIDHMGFCEDFDEDCYKTPLDCPEGWLACYLYAPEKGLCPLIKVN